VREAVRTAAVLTRRTLLSTMRDRGVVVIRTGAAVLIGLLCGGCFYQSGTGPRINALLFVMCVFALFCVPAISRYDTGRATVETVSLAGCAVMGTCDQHVVRANEHGPAHPHSPEAARTGISKTVCSLCVSELLITTKPARTSPQRSAWR
jgi:hypothetical protein